MFRSFTFVHCESLRLYQFLPRFARNQSGKEAESELGFCHKPLIVKSTPYNVAGFFAAEVEYTRKRQKVRKGSPPQPPDVLVDGRRRGP